MATGTEAVDKRNQEMNQQAICSVNDEHRVWIVLREWAVMDQIMTDDRV